jgi:hypothetical protein
MRTRYSGKRGPPARVGLDRVGICAGMEGAGGRGDGEGVSRFRISPSADRPADLMSVTGIAHQRVVDTSEAAGPDQPVRRLPAECGGDPVGCGCDRGAWRRWRRRLGQDASSGCEPANEPVFIDLPTVPLPVLSASGMDYLRVAPYVPEAQEMPLPGGSDTVFGAWS